MDHDCLANDANIPTVYVEATVGYGDPGIDTNQILGTEYVDLLRQYLIMIKLPTMADEISGLRTQLAQEFGA